MNFEESNRYGIPREIVDHICGELSPFFEELNITYILEEPLYNNTYLNFYMSTLEYRIIFTISPCKKVIEIVILEWFGSIKQLYYGVLFIPAKKYCVNSKITKIKDTINNLKHS